MKKILRMFLIATIIITLLMTLTSCSELVEVVKGLFALTVVTIIMVIIIAIMIAIIVNTNKTEKEIEQEKFKRKIEEAAKQKRLEDERIEKARQNAIEEQKRIKEAKEAEEKRIKEEQEAEEERLRNLNTKCVICGKNSMGNTICRNCIDRNYVLLEQIPKNALRNFESLFSYYKAKLNDIVNSVNEVERIYNSSCALAAVKYLKDNYLIEDELSSAYDFLEDFRDSEYTLTDEFIEKYKKYDIHRIEYSQKEHQTSKNSQISYEEAISKKTKERDETAIPQSGKTFRCNDGDYVRSKAEREIDNFFFANRIWHIYEQPYTSPVEDITTHPDFYLPDHNLYIEYFGLNTPEYNEIREKKIKMYMADGKINFEYLTYEDDADMNTKLTNICKKYSISVR